MAEGIPDSTADEKEMDRVYREPENKSNMPHGRRKVTQRALAMGNCRRTIGARQKSHKTSETENAERDVF